MVFASRIRALAMVAVAVQVLLGPGPGGADEPRPRARDLGIEPGRHPPGPRNAITDVPGVLVAHVTLRQGPDVRTGVTAVLPHPGNLYQEKVPAAIVVHNGYGKLVGFTQIRELGAIETPILLTNTLQVWDAAAAVVEHMLALPENRSVRSINPVVGETNDGRLNDIRGRHLRRSHFLEAIRSAHGGEVAEGSIGAGTGTVAFGWKGGIGTSSRKLDGGYVLGVMVQTNFGGSLTVGGVPVWRTLRPDSHSPERKLASADGSCMIVVATDAPLDARQLTRLARRAFAGMARVGASFSHGSGDYVIAFSTSPDVRIRAGVDSPREVVLLPDAALSPLFEAVAGATEEAILNSLLRATTTEGRDNSRAVAIPIEPLREILADGGGSPAAP